MILGRTGIEVGRRGLGLASIGGMFAPVDDAIQFPLRHPAVACVVVGARSPDEIAGSAALLDHPVPEEVWHYIGSSTTSR